MSSGLAIFFIYDVMIACDVQGQLFDEEYYIVASTNLGLIFFIVLTVYGVCRSCAQCFREFEDGVFFEYDGRKYCEHDFHVLFAPCCQRCNTFIIGW